MHGSHFKSSLPTPYTAISVSDMDGLYWTKTSRSCQLGVRVKDGPTTNFLGFREKVLSM